jgi:hypothetical protein
MKARALILTLALWFTGAALSFAQSPEIGTWKLNEPVSTIPDGAVRNTTVVYAAQGDTLKITTDGTGTDGKPVHTEWAGKLDGRDYRVSGDPAEDTRSYKKVDAHTLELTQKKNGKVVATGQSTVAEDGMSRTLTLHSTDSAGNKVFVMAIYDKQ